jgi:hypothetical protein
MCENVLDINFPLMIFSELNDGNISLARFAVFLRKLARSP